MKKIVFILFAVFLFFGCLSPVKKLGCCVAENVTNGDGCLLLNMSDGEFYDYTSDTVECDNPDRNLSGLCNVSLNGEYTLVPVCTDDELTECLMPDCVAMVCGDFKYTPRVAPAFGSMDDATSYTPVDTEEVEVQNFYKAQCRFLDMDTKLQRIMRNSNSMINVFRIGIGGSFDEYDQYRYLFPLTDKFCGIGESVMGGEGVDRYVNYLQPSLEPVEESTEDDCVDKENVPPQLGFSDEDLSRETIYSLIGPEGDKILYSWSPPYVDSASYAFNYYATIITELEVEYEGGEEWLSQGTDTVSGLHKNLDKEFYRKMLPIVYADDIFDPDTKRAPFECDSESMECYSGYCDTSFYSRGVLVSTEGEDVLAECIEVVDDGYHKRVVCSPLVNVNPSSEEGEPPEMRYSRVTVRPWQYVVETVSYAQKDLTEGADDPEGDCSGMGDYHRCKLRENWENMFNTEEGSFNFNEDNSYVGREYTVREIPGAIRFYEKEEKDCEDYPGSSSTSEVQCSEVETTSEFPPASSVVFFGSGKDDGRVVYNGQTIIGYIIADPSDFDDIFLVDNCGLSMENINDFPEPASCKQLDEEEYDECYLKCMNIGFCGWSGDVEGMGESCIKYCSGKLKSLPCNPQEGPYSDQLEPEDYPQPATCEELPDESSVDQEEYDECFTLCNSFCSYLSDTESACDSYCSMELPGKPCNPYTEPLAPAVNTEDFIRVEIGNPDENPEAWRSLSNAFVPLFEQKMDDIAYSDFDDGCGNLVDDSDLVLSSMPWVIAYDKGSLDFSGSHYSLFEPHYHISYGPEVLSEKNVYDFSVPPVDTLGTSSCDLRFGTTTMVYKDTVVWNYPEYFYWMVYPEYIYLIKYNPEDNAMGDCKVNSQSLLPEVRTYGWCEPCTVSTIAYQEMETTDDSYYSAYRVDLNDSTSEQLCTLNTDLDVPSYDEFTLTDLLSCRDYPVDGLSEYSGTIQQYKGENNDFEVSIVSAPRTVPEASVFKERLIEYMKSGVLPVVDLSDESNWDRNLTSTELPFEGYFEEYDFQRSFGKSGGIVTITEWVDGGSAANKDDAIIDRTTALRKRCYGCLNAVGVRADSFESFNRTLEKLMSNPMLSVQIDLIAYEYEVSEHSYESSGAENITSEVVSDLESQSRFALQEYGMPTLVVPFNVESDGTWSDEDYEILFRGVVDSKERFASAGMIGLVYAPVRSYHEGLTIPNPNPFNPGGKTIAVPSNTQGLVDVDFISAVGDPTGKLCAMENAMNNLVSSSPIAMFNKITTVESVNCTKCTSLDRITGDCDKTCDNGVECLMPSEVPSSEQGNYRCPENAIPDGVPGSCRLCNETPGTYRCVYRYSNGTKETVEYDSSQVDSELYIDVIAGIEKPDKCCVLDSATDRTYSFMKTTVASASERPVVFSESGDPYQDCGVSNPLDKISEGGFCGVEVPTENYDITCEFIPE